MTNSKEMIEGKCECKVCKNNKLIKDIYDNLNESDKSKVDEFVDFFENEMLDYDWLKGQIQDNEVFFVNGKKYKAQLVE